MHIFDMHILHEIKYSVKVHQKKTRNLIHHSEKQIK